MARNLSVAGRLGTDAHDEDLAEISHELRAPLTSLLGYARMLRANWDRIEPSRRGECFDVMERQGRKLLQMIEGILHASGTGARRIRRDPLDLSAIVAAAVQTATGLSGGHRFEVEVPDEPLDVFGDASAVEQIVTNLIENAVKYSPDGTPIRVSVTERPREIHVVVADEGPGIAREDLPVIFERYRRGGEVAERGYGLGLSIVRRLVEAHGGRVWVRSTPGAGAAFSFSLPRRVQTVAAGRSAVLSAARQR